MTLGCFCTDCRFTAEPTEPNLSLHYLNAFWDALKTLDDKIIVYTCNCCSGFALALLTDGNSNGAFWSVDPHGDFRSACSVNQEAEEAGDVKEYNRERTRSICWFYNELVQMGKPQKNLM